jgi:hypothetical protein
LSRPQFGDIAVGNVPDIGLPGIEAIDFLLIDIEADGGETCP